jgi:citrate synthase
VPVLDMLLDIKTVENAEPWVRNELAAGRRIMGFGHRVYKVRDPRAEVLSTVAEEMGGAVLNDTAPVRPRARGRAHRAPRPR